MKDIKIQQSVQVPKYKNANIYIESNDGKVPLILTGYKDKMDEFLQKYQLKIV